jgi:hypothetical protein
LLQNLDEKGKERKKECVYSLKGNGYRYTGTLGDQSSHHLLITKLRGGAMRETLEL